jgi:hypothetical protein
MKYLLIIALLFPQFVLAAQTCSEEQAVEKKEINTDVPTHLRGATIIIRQVDGKESSVPAEKFKVVPRKQQYLVTKSLMTCSASEKNRASVLAGYGGTGALSKDTSKLSSGQTTVHTKEGFVGGVQIQRKVSERLSIGVQGQSNKTGSILLGIDF